jgi:hypothetical protein
MLVYTPCKQALAINFICAERTLFLTDKKMHRTITMQCTKLERDLKER